MAPPSVAGFRWAAPVKRLDSAALRHLPYPDSCMQIKGLGLLMCCL